jgi:hypothetical protein
MEMERDGGSAQQKAEYVSRPTLGDLLSKDIFLYAVASGVIVIWVLYLTLVYLVEGDSAEEGGLSNEMLFLIFLLVTLGDMAILGWRVRYFSAFANRGVETEAKIVGVTGVGDQISVEYEYVFQAEHLKGTAGVGGLSPRKKAEGLVGREIFILVDPERPKRTLVLSKLR